MEDNFSGLELAPDETIEIIEFGELKEGDVLIGSQGRTSVVHGFDAHIPTSMYEVETDSGAVLELSGNHLLYVVKATDRDLHRDRLAQGKRIGKTLDADSVRALWELAESDEDSHGLIGEFLDFLSPKSPELTAALIRVAESLGPASESNLLVDDLGGSDEPLFSATIQNYHRAHFAQQVLSALNIGDARKRWPTVVGTVLTVEMLENYDPQDIYIPDPPRDSLGETK